MRAAPDGIFRWTMLTNDDGRLVAILGETWRRREEAVFAPPIDNKVGGFVGKRAMEELVASINAGDYRLAGARILELPQFLNDKVSQRAVLRWFYNAGGVYSFLLYSDFLWRGGDFPP